MTISRVTKARNLEVPGAEGSVEFSSGFLEFLQGAESRTGFYTQHLQVALDDAIGLPIKKIYFEPWQLLHINDQCYLC